MPRSRMRRANSRTIGNGFMNTSSPKLSEPALSVAISGLHRSGCARSSALMPTAPPVVVCTMTSQRARMARIAFSNSARSWVGVPSSLRTCRWMTAAPACAQRSASAASSSAVMGRYGVCSRVVSAPQIAAVRMAGRTGMRRILPRRPEVRSVGERRAFLHFLDGAAHLALLVLLGQVAQADHPEWLRVLVADEDARDLPLFHQLGDLLHVFVGPDADYVLGHDLVDLGAFQIAGLGDEARSPCAPRSASSGWSSRPRRSRLPPRRSRPRAAARGTPPTRTRGTVPRRRRAGREARWPRPRRARAPARRPPDRRRSARRAPTG